MYKAFLSAIILASIPATVFAAQSCGNVDTSIISCSSGDGNPIWSLLEITINILAGLIGLAAIGGLIFGSILYTSAGDNASQITKAKTTITNVVVGLVMFAGMYAFIQYLIPGGIFNVDMNTPVATPRDNNNNNGNNNGNNNQNGNNQNRRANVRIGVYNAKSVNESAASQRSRFITGWSKIKNRTDIVVMAEFSRTHNTYMSNFSNWSVYYPANARGDRGLAVLFRSDKYNASNRGSVTIPLISTTNQNVTRHEPTITLTRKDDGAKVSIMAVHLAAINGNQARWRENQRNQQPVIGRWLKNAGSETRVAAGDFNWYMPGNTTNLTGVEMRHKGERVMRVMIPKSQKFGGFYTTISGSGFSDHPQVIADIETTWFR